ncbi:MAG: S8 family peptidase [Sphingomonadaceae bacterium]
MDPALLELISAGAPDDEVAVIVRVKTGREPPANLRIVARFGDIATARTHRGELAAIHASNAVKSLKAPRVYSGEDPPDEDNEDNDEPGLSESSPVTRPEDTRRPRHLPERGRGTVICVIDWGLDFAHPDFRHSDGSTRLLALWDQRAQGRPAPYGYGKIYGAAEINQALSSANPFRSLGYQPISGTRPAHGTHVAGIAAGNGYAGGPEGVAPEADLVFIHLGPGAGDLGNSIDLLEAVHFAAETAGNKPLAINMSIGRHAGPHDGSLLIEQAIDWMVLNRPGTVIVQSTGNYFDRRVHMEGRLHETRVAELPFTVPPIRGSLPTVEVWYKGADRFTASATAPDGARVTVERGSSAPLTGRKGQEYARFYHRSFDPNSGDHLIALVLRENAPPGEWTIELTGQDVVDGRWHAWIERNAPCPSCQPTFAADAVSGCTTTGSICNALRTIAVGAYNAHGRNRLLARFSSVGPTRDGRPKPLLAAPGVRVLSARSRTDPASEPGYIRMSGTSMAAPHVTGTVALMMEAAGRHPVEAIRRVLFASLEAAPDDSPRWGYGLLDTEAAVRGARRLRTGQHPEPEPIHISREGSQALTLVPHSSLPEDISIMSEALANNPAPNTRPPADQLWTKGRDQTLPTPEQRVLSRFSDDELRAMLGESDPPVAVASREDWMTQAPEALLAQATDPLDVSMNILGWPGRRLDTPLEAGDILLSQPIAGKMRSAIVTDSYLSLSSELPSENGVNAIPGHYASVAGSTGYWRVTGPEGLLLEDIIVLRGFRESLSDAEAFPAAAEIGQNLDAITVNTRQVDLGVQPNFIALNEITPRNTTAKRDVFGNLKQALDNLKARERTQADAIANGHGVPTATQQRAIERANRAVEQARQRIERSAMALTRWVRAEGPRQNQATQTLRDRMAAFQPIVDVIQNHHRISVEGTRISLHDNVVTYATDNLNGLVGKAQGDNRANVTAVVAASGLGADSRAILDIVSRHEGTFSSVNSWDRAVVTFGFIQWTFGSGGNGSLVGLLDAFRQHDASAFADYYEKYGIGTDGGEAVLLQRDGTRLTGGDAARAIRTDVRLMAVISRAGTHAGFQTVQVAHAHAHKIVAMRQSRISGYPVRAGDVVSSVYGTGIMADRAVHSGEGAVRNAIKRALDRFVTENPGADLSQETWRAPAEDAATDALVAMNRRRAGSFASLDHARGSFRD